LKSLIKDVAEFFKIEFDGIFDWNNKEYENKNF